MLLFLVDEGTVSMMVIMLRAVGGWTTMLQNFADFASLVETFSSV